MYATLELCLLPYVTRLLAGDSIVYYLSAVMQSSVMQLLWAALFSVVPAVGYRLLPLSAAPEQGAL